MAQISRAFYGPDFLLLAALGLMIILGVVNVINLAHGELIMLGAYITTIAYHQANLPLHIDYGPANPKAFDTGVIKPERAAQLPSAPENAAKQALMSYAWWSSPAGEAAEKRWVGFMQK